MTEIIINTLLFLSALCTLVEFGFILFMVFVGRRFLKDCWNYWTKPLHVLE